MKNTIKHITKYLDKVFSPFSRNTTIKSKDYAYYLVKSSQGNTYVETHSNKADSLHWRIKGIYEEDIFESYFIVLKDLIKFKRFSRIKVAIDYTHEDFYGDTRDFHIYEWNNKKQAQFHYIVLSIVNKECKIPVMAFPVMLGHNKKKLVELLLNYVEKLFCKPGLVLFDRGFNNSELIAYLEEQRYKYLMLAQKCKTFSCMLEAVGIECPAEKLVVLKHEMTYCRDKSKHKITTNLVLIYDVADYDWCFYTNLRKGDAFYYIITYKKRWNIETDFRVQDEAHIKSKSSCYLIRFFYFMFSLLLHAIWSMKLKLSMPFKLFLIKIYEMMFCNILNVDYISFPP